MYIPTRSRIVDYLQKQRTATVEELSHALDMTGMNIRHHLAFLENYGYIETAGFRKEGRGRPKKIYSLANRILGDGLQELVRAILRVFLRNKEREEIEKELRSAAAILAGDDPPKPTMTLGQRLALLIERLNMLHYQSHWEAGLTGPTIILGHCPYAEIISSHPEICQIDAYMMEQWSYYKVDLIAKLRKNNKGVPSCTFKVLNT